VPALPDITKELLKAARALRPGAALRRHRKFMACCCNRTMTLVFWSDRRVFVVGAERHALER
jgi:hypothetical protein